MKRLLALALVLGAVSCGSKAKRVGLTEQSVAVAPTVPPTTVTAPLVPPPGAVALYYADPRCPPAAASVALPSAAARDCYALQSRLAILRIVQREKLSPGPASPCWAYSDPGVYRACLDVAARALPPQAYGLSARYVDGLLYGEPWSGCAAGATYADYIFAKLSEPARVLPLVAHEAPNHWLRYTYDRKDLTDGPLVSEADTAALAACGVN